MNKFMLILSNFEYIYLFFKYDYLNKCFHVCDEWDGTESRGNGARPVELMMMSDTCTTHRSRVPTEELRKDKRRSDDSARRERTRPGL